ncbi:MAG: DUF2878 domain-containing protein [SAR324 cluster bacterium]|nr:DUF2878 domain-containing protein [SAR324 cluster bacterium]
MKNLLNFLFFQVAWFVCVWSVGQGIPYYGVLVVAAALIAHLCWITTDRAKEVLFILKIIFLGGIVETLSSSLGLIEFKQPSVILQSYPLYMWAIWANFAMTLNHSMRWLSGRYLLGFILGGIAGPLAYYGAEKLGAIHLEWETTTEWLGFALIWAVTMLIIIRFLMKVPADPMDHTPCKHPLSQTTH